MHTNRFAHAMTRRRWAMGLRIAYLVLGLAVLATPVEAGWIAQTSGTSVVLRGLHFPVDTSTGWRNNIHNNGWAGVGLLGQNGTALSSIHVRIRQNRFSANAGISIDLMPDWSTDGITLNDGTSYGGPTRPTCVKLSDRQVLRA